MNHVKSDPLLRTAAIVINVAMVVFALATIFLLLFIPIFYLMSDRMIDAGSVTVRAISATGTEIIMPLAIVMVALGFQFLRTLRRIVISVREGNPFTIVNANRLNAMAWLALIIQAVSIVAGLIGNSPIEHDAADLHLSISGFTGVLVGLVLLVLARVFRVGADMREELEGTI